MKKKMNEALIKVINNAKIKNHDLISKGTGIDKSTVSLHLSGKREINIHHAKKYAKYLDISLLDVLDETTIKYRVVKYVNYKGIVGPPTEEDFHVIVSPNEKRALDRFVIYDKFLNQCYWYSKNINCSNADVVNKYCYIKGVPNKSFDMLGTVIEEKKIKGKHMIKLINQYQKSKEINMEYSMCYPITAITFLNFSNSIKIDNKL
tara:strand:+ start:147 stop:761 length:615 start_codon:yes stop_codon:yes gene_type:complete